MFFQQVKVEGIGCYSYIIGCLKEGKAFVIDPKRDIETYLNIADENGLKITGIIDTHVHADHISGSQELRAQTGADIYIHKQADAAYAHKPLREGDQFVLGTIKIDVIHTPGHTPNSVTLVVTDLSLGNSPEMILTGDLLFIGSIGRPDLAGGELLEEQIANEYKSLHEKFAHLPDQVQVYPAHGAGSLCGSGLSANPSSTLGFERSANPYFKLSFDEFRKELTQAIPVRPKNFTRIIAQNRNGAAHSEDLPPVKQFSVAELKRFVSSGKMLIDLRDAAAFGGAHIPGSINIGFTPPSANWLGMVVDPEQEIGLLAGSKADIDDAVIHFRRVGYDRIVGYHLGISEWIAEGEETGFLPQLSIHGLQKAMKKYPDHAVVDVRTRQEWDSGHITGALQIPLQQIIEEGVNLNQGDYISVICGSGYRSNIAGSLLKSRGYQHIYSVIGGMNAWKTRYAIES